jgi:hypothetical protein
MQLCSYTCRPCCDKRPTVPQCIKERMELGFCATFSARFLAAPILDQWRGRLSIAGLGDLERVQAPPSPPERMAEINALPPSRRQRFHRRESSSGFAWPE